MPLRLLLLVVVFSVGCQTGPIAEKYLAPEIQSKLKVCRDSAGVATWWINHDHGTIRVNCNWEFKDE